MANAESREVFTAVKALLTADATLSSYIKGIDEGLRQNTQPEDFPRIVLEPQVENEIREEVNIKRDQFFTIRILGLLFVNEGNIDNQIVGTGGAKGIMDLFEDVRNALDADRTLSGKAIRFDWIPTVYDFEGYPIRMFTCAIRAMHRRTVTL